MKRAFRVCPLHCAVCLLLSLLYLFCSCTTNQSDLSHPQAPPPNHMLNLAEKLPAGVRLVPKTKATGTHQWPDIGQWPTIGLVCHGLEAVGVSENVRFSRAPFRTWPPAQIATDWNSLIRIIATAFPRF